MKHNAIRFSWLMYLNYLFFLIFLALLACENAAATNYKFKPYVNDSSFIKTYYDGKMTISLNRECENSKCTYTLVRDHIDQIATFSENNSVYDIVADGFYKDAAWVVVRERKLAIKNYYYLIDHSGTKTNIDYDPSEDMVTTITKDGTVYGVNDKEIRKNGKRLLAAPEPLKRAIIITNENGDIGVTAISESLAILASDGQSWTNTGIQLNSDSDFNDVLAEYVSEDKIQYGSVYVYINSYCKGVKLFYVNRATGASDQGWLYSSEENNIGYSPKLSNDNNMMYLNVLNSTDNDRVSFSLSPEDFQHMDPAVEAKILSECDQRDIKYNIGSGVISNFWLADTRTGDMNVDYNINNSLFMLAHFDASIGNTKLAINMLRNKAEDYNDTTRKSSRYVNYLFDFNSDRFKSIRLNYEKSNVAGSAEISGDSSAPIVFDSKFIADSVLFMDELGIFYGAQYTKYEMPSALAFYSTTISRSYFDPATRIRALSVMFGYDANAYAARYENNYSRWYVDGYLGVGLADIALSPQTDAQVSRDFAGQSIGGTIPRQKVLGSRRLVSIRNKY